MFSLLKVATRNTSWPKDYDTASVRAIGASSASHNMITTMMNVLHISVAFKTVCATGR